MSNDELRDHDKRTIDRLIGENLGLKAERDRLENLRLKLRLSLYHLMNHVEETLGDWTIEESEHVDEEYLSQLTHFREIMRREARS